MKEEVEEIENNENKQQDVSMEKVSTKAIVQVYLEDELDEIGDSDPKKEISKWEGISEDKKKDLQNSLDNVEELGKKTQTGPSQDNNKKSRKGIPEEVKIEESRHVEEDKEKGKKEQEKVSSDRDFEDEEREI